MVSIIGIEHFGGGYIAVKRVHEQAYLDGPVPSRSCAPPISTNSSASSLDWGTHNGTAHLPEMRTQLVSARTVGETLAALATGADGPAEIAGPREESLVAVARLLAALPRPLARVEASRPLSRTRALRLRRAAARTRCCAGRPDVRGVAREQLADPHPRRRVEVQGLALLRQRRVGGGDLLPALCVGRADRDVARVAADAAADLG